MSRTIDPLEYPSWPDFLAFEGPFYKCLEDLATLRRGRSVRRKVAGGDKTQTIYLEGGAGLYTPVVRRFIDEGAELLSQGPVGAWLTKVRHLVFDDAVKEARRSLLTSVTLVPENQHSSGLHAVRKYQERERDLRFFGELAVLSGRFHWKTWNQHSDTKVKVGKFAKKQIALSKDLQKLMEDRYLRRYLSSQDLAAIPQLLKMLNGVRESLSFVVGQVPVLRPFERWKEEDGAGLRQAIAGELVDLCLLSFGQCSKQMLEDLLVGIGVELPASLPSWLATQIETTRALIADQQEARGFVNVLLPREKVDDPRRPQYEVLPWLIADLGAPEAGPASEPKGD